MSNSTKTRWPGTEGATIYISSHPVNCRITLPSPIPRWSVHDCCRLATFFSFKLSVSCIGHVAVVLSGDKGTSSWTVESVQPNNSNIELRDCLKLASVKPSFQGIYAIEIKSHVLSGGAYALAVKWTLMHSLFSLYLTNWIHSRHQSFCSRIACLRD